MPARDFPEKKHSPNFQNLSPRLGAAYDLFGDGRTALKVALGRYPVRNTGVAVDLPVANQAQSTTRSWADANGNFVPDCDLRNPLTNGECGQWGDLTFGQQRGGNVRRAEDALEGFNVQNYNWQGSVSVQRQLRSNMGLEVGYFRTSYGGFLAYDNQLVTPADYDPYCITAPVDSRLPSSVSGKQFCGNYDINPAKFGRVDNLSTLTSHYGKQIEVFNGVDVVLNSRFGQGGRFQGSLSTGSVLTDNSLVIDSPSSLTSGTPTGAGLAIPINDARPGFCRVSRPWSGGTAFGFNVVYPLPWNIQTSAIYQNKPGFPIRATYQATNAEIRPSLGRHLSTCPSQTAATCTQTVLIDLIPNNTLYGERIKQLDLRFSRFFPLGGNARVQGNFDLYNILNNSTVLNEQQRYSTTQWRNALQIMGGRMIKLGAQLTF
jgi:hypothetical protein